MRRILSTIWWEAEWREGRAESSQRKKVKSGGYCWKMDAERTNPFEQRQIVKMRMAYHVRIMPKPNRIGVVVHRRPMKFTHTQYAYDTWHLAHSYWFAAHCHHENKALSRSEIGHILSTIGFHIVRRSDTHFESIVLQTSIGKKICLLLTKSSFLLAAFLLLARLLSGLTWTNYLSEDCKPLLVVVFLLIGCVCLKKRICKFTFF